MAQTGRSSSGEAPIGHVEIGFSGSCVQLTGPGGHRAGSGGIGLEAIEMSSSDPLRADLGGSVSESCGKTREGLVLLDGIIWDQQALP